VSTNPTLPFDGAPPPGRRPARQIVTVTELTNRIRVLLESTHGQVWVEGEIANCRLWKTGHLYFTLRDENAQLKAVMFRSAARYLRFAPEDGLRVVARGRVTVYEPKGEYQIVCEHLQPQGLGALQLAFDQLKRKLDAEGLFARDRKRPLPVLPRQIGIVTSRDGAAVRDILQVLGRRHRTAHVVLCPVRVQGEGAADEIARGVRRLAQQDGVDVIIVGRGGGSLEDLWAFNEEPVARAIAAAPVPVISAVGHEIDFTISDMVADVRAATPSAAAEIVVAGRGELLERIDRLAARLRTALQDAARRRRTRLIDLDRRPGLTGWPARLAMRGRYVAGLSHAIDRLAHAGLGTRERRLGGVQLRLEACEPGRRLEAARSRLVAAGSRLDAALVRRRERAQGRLTELSGRLDALSPLGVLGRGYAICWQGDRRAIVRDAAAVSVGDDLVIGLGRGRLGCTVTGKDEPHE
jgi:exodeoxyribonuclease VII large subunit